VRDAREGGRHRAERAGHAALDDAALIGLADKAFLGSRSLVVAVSGGADSMLAMLITRLWRDAYPNTAVDIHIATVDHGLRPEASEEAAWVGDRARSLGFVHHTLRWAAGKPATGVQAAARAARYRLLAGLVDSLALPRPAGIVVGHHAEDQAETFVMRLARGSGVDGLAAMPLRRELPGAPGIDVVRPLIGLARSQIVAALKRQGWTWREDPSNEDRAFERVRVRQALDVLAELGVERSAIAEAARRLGRARSALEQATADLAARALDMHGGAYATIGLDAFLAAPAEIQLRLVQLLVERFGAGTAEARLARLETLAERLAAGTVTGATLGGCRLERKADRIVAVREPGRAGLPALRLAPGETRMWDNRFEVVAARELHGEVEVRALTGGEVTEIVRRRRADGFPAIELPRSALLTLPSFWQHNRLIGVGHPDGGRPGAGLVTARFVFDVRRP
jgi:tRNA(Ile)-lysidine synthase